MLDAAKFSLYRKNCDVGGLPDIGRPVEISTFAAPAPCMFFLLTAGVFAFILLNRRRCGQSSVRGWIRHGNYRSAARIIAEAGIFSAQNAAPVAATFLSRKFEVSPAAIISPAVFVAALMTAVSALSGQVKRFSARERQRLAGILERR